MTPVQDTPPDHSEPRSESRLRSMVVAIGGVITAVIGLMAAPAWPIAALLTALIVLGVAFALVVDNQLRDLKRTNARQQNEISGCRGEHEKCRKDLHARDVLIAMFYVHIAHGTERRRGDRRKPTAFPSELEVAFEKTVGPERAPGILEEARRLLAIAG